MDKIESLAYRELGNLEFDGDQETSDVRPCGEGNYFRTFLNPSFFVQDDSNGGLPLFAYEQDVVNHIRGHFHGLILENYRIRVIATDINTLSVHLERIDN